jgi:hypothetical protein
MRVLSVNSCAIRHVPNDDSRAIAMILTCAGSGAITSNIVFLNFYDMTSRRRFNGRAWTNSEIKARVKLVVAYQIELSIIVS